MEEWLEGFKIYVVVAFYFVLIASIYAYDLYVRKSSNEGVSGSLGFAEIPKALRWMPIVAGLCGLYIIVYSLLFVIHPDIQNYYLPVQALQNTRVSLFGMGLVFVGMVLILICQFQLGRSYRLNLPTGQTQLVTHGLYAISRNPLYMGLYIALFGIFFMLPNWIYLFCLLFLILNYHYKITTLEEPFLQQRFGDEFRDYCFRVNRYF